MMGMPAINRSVSMPGTTAEFSDREKIQRIREKMREIFGGDIAISDALLSRRYTITLEGDLVMILR